MKKRRRILPLILTGVIITVILCVLMVILFSESAIKLAIGTAGTQALNVGVKVDEIDLSIAGGRLDLHNLRISNFPDYEQEILFELNQTSVSVNAKSLLSDIVTIGDIKLDGIQVFLEQRGVSGNNLQDIITQLPSEQESSDPPKGKKLHINNLEINNTQVNIKLLPVSGKIDTIPLKLGTIRLSDLGNDNDLDVIVLSRTILLAIAEGIAKQGADILPDEMLASLVSEPLNLGTLSDTLLHNSIKSLESGRDVGAGTTRTGQKAGEDTIKGVEDIGRSFTEGLGELLG